jgi:thiol-disulfide isomerase/thioredoxin
MKTSYLIAGLAALLVGAINVDSRVQLDNLDGGPLVQTTSLHYMLAQEANSAYAQTSIRLKGTDGKTYDISNFRGSVILLSFGATWCQPCKEELKALEELKKEYKDKPVKFLWVDIEGTDQVSDGDLRDYAKKLKVSFPVLRDPDNTTFSRFSPRRRLPTILFFDKLGRLSLPNHVGMSAVPLYMSTMRARLDRLLALNAPNSFGNK